MKIFPTCSDAIFATLAYADCFDYPLTPKEITKFLIGYSAPLTEVQKTLKSMSGNSVHPYGACTLPNRESIIPLRHRRMAASKKKWEIVYRVSRWLAYIPTIECIGVTGALSMDNADASDDIDLFFIVSPHTLFITRLLTIFVVDVVAKRRKPKGKETANTFCLNMFVTRDALVMPTEDQDVYIAHEILQMVPVFVRGRVYQSFLEANSWVKHFMPNLWHERMKQTNRLPSYVPGFVFAILRFFNRLAEPIARHFELGYMKGKRTREIVSDTVLRFHPRDTRRIVFDAFAARLKTANIPLDNVFETSIK